VDPLTESLTLQSHLPPDFLVEALRADVTRGLTATPKSLPPKWFYDERGSVLFEEITRLPEYYPTRAEREILLARAPEIAATTGARTLVELGSGSGEKTRLLIEALRAHGTLAAYVPMDVSPSALLESGRALVRDYPGLSVHGRLADFEHQLGVDLRCLVERFFELQDPVLGRRRRIHWMHWRIVAQRISSLPPLWPELRGPRLR